MNNMDEVGYTYTLANMPRDEDGFIQLIPKHPIGKTDTIRKRFMNMNTDEIILHHGHISICNYKMGDNFEFEKSLSVWNKVTFRYELIGGYYIPEYKEFCINRGYDLQKLKHFFPNHPIRVVNDPYSSKKIDIDLFAPPRNDFQKVALTFMTHQGIYETIRHTQQIVDADTGDGKAMPDDTPILTPTGWVRIDSLKVGDYVIGSNGKKTKVLGIYPQKGLQETYEITFKDGRKTRCNKEHLWHVITRNGKSHILPLSEIMKDYLRKNTDNNSVGYRYSIPLPDPIQFEHQDTDVDPYLAGENALYNGFIPDVYLYNDIETRWSVLQGIMDNNGRIIKNTYKLHVNAKSETLKNNIIELVRSLGYMASASLINDRYLIKIFSVPDADKAQFFRNNKRAVKYAKKANNGDGIKRLNIVDIKEVNPTNQRCIKVEAKDHLYVCENYIVTHNTYCGVATVAYWKHKAIIFVPFSKLLEQWKEAFLNFTSLEDKDIMIIQGSSVCEKILNGKCDHIKIFICSTDTITSFQKRHGNLKTIDLLKATGAYIKIIDEIHRDIRAVSMIEALSNFRLNYYMSASPGRAEQKENWIFKTLFRNVPKFGSSFKTQEEKHITVMIKKFKWTPDYNQIKAMVNKKTGLNIKAYERELINSPPYQRQSFDDAIAVLLNWAKNIMKSDKRLMLMAQSIETLYYIQNLAEKVFPGETSVYYGGLSKKEKAAALEKRIIVATDSSLGTGANIPNLQFLIYCSTYSNWLTARQLSGRLRKLDDGTQVVYIELLNTGYLKTMRQFDKRKSELQARSKTGKLFYVE